MIEFRLHKRIMERWVTSWQDAAASSIGASLAWIIAHWVLGHPQPVFAAIAAMVCLAPGLPSHGKQAIGLLLGVSTGILIGEFSLLLPHILPMVKIIFMTFFAMMIGVLFGRGAVIPIQAGASSLLVILLGTSSAGPTRLIDVTVGTSIGLIFSQILLTPDPVRMIDQSARAMMSALHKGFNECASAIMRDDRKQAEAALARFTAAHDSLNALDTVIASARSSARWSLRGRLAAGAVADMAKRYDRKAIQLYASTLLFAENLANAVGRNEAPPPSLMNRMMRVAERCAILAREAATPDNKIVNDRHDAPDAPISLQWGYCLESMRTVEEALSSFEQSEKIIHSAIKKKAEEKAASRQ